MNHEWLRDAEVFKRITVVRAEGYEISGTLVGWKIHTDMIDTTRPNSLVHEYVPGRTHVLVDIAPWGVTVEVLHTDDVSVE
jgi:hypothetical protein